MDLFWYLNLWEIELARNVMDVMDDQINAWRIPENREVEVCDDAYIAKLPKIRAKLRYVRSMSTCWTEQVRQERRCRSMLGYVYHIRRRMHISCVSLNKHGRLLGCQHYSVVSRYRKGVMLNSQQRSYTFGRT